jgi:O-methyltransferase
VKRTLKRIIRRVLHHAGYDVIPYSPRAVGPPPTPEVMEAKFHELRKQAAPYTMTSVERMYALYKSVEYIVHNRVPGDFVECGVWKGGSAMLIALVLRDLGATDRRIFLYDTFEGMSEPTGVDRSITGEFAPATWPQTMTGEVSSWCYAGLEEVMTNLSSTGYPRELLHFVQGKVEDTVPATLPGPVALLRLDTDWYESTYHELQHLFPLICRGGVLIIDDYGYWQGAKKAVDDYFRDAGTRPLLVRLDSTGRLAVKMA